MINQHKRLTGLAVTAFTLSTCGSSVFAQEKSRDVFRVSVLEEVTVTAQKFEETLQGTPIAISVLNESQLSSLGISSLEALESGAIPSLGIVPHGNTTSTLTVAIRGNGPTDIAQATREGSVAIYQDGIYLGRAQGLSMELAELDRVEVLRGPQGTLFGRNATSGAISLVSKKPTGEFGLKQTVGLGNYNALRSVTRVNLPEFSGVSTKLEYIQSERDGWVKNTAPDASDFNESDKSGGRLSVHWQASESSSFDYTYDKSEVEASHLYFQLYLDASGIIGEERQRETSTRFPIQLDPSKTDIEAHALTGTWELNDALTFKSLSSRRRMDEDSNNNFGGTLNANGLNISERTEQQQWSQEFQLIGRYDDLQWVAGLYYFQEDVEQDIQLLFTLDTDGSITQTGVPFTPIEPPTTFGLPTSFIEAEVESRAVYGQGTWGWSERASLTFGARYTQDDKSGSRFQFAAQNFDFDSDSLDASLSLNYDWTPNVMSYIKWGSAYKAGGVNVRSATFGPYDKEVVDTWELGFKSEFWEQRLRMNLAVFSSDYDDMQFDFINPANVTVNETLNATETVKVEGFEMDLTAVPVDGLLVGLSYTHINSKVPIQPNPLNPSVLQRFEISQTPEHAGSLMMDYTFAPGSFGTLSAHLDITSTSRFAYVATPSPHQDSYTLVNARLTLSDIDVMGGTFRVTAWGKNLTDEAYSALSFPVGDAALRSIRAYGMPRTSGVDVSYEF